MSNNRQYPGPDRAPFRSGNLEEYPGSRLPQDERYEWRENVPFAATLELVGTERGRSAMRFIWHDVATGARYPMFATDMAALVMTRDGARAGKADGQWIVMKRGQNYGIARYVA